MRDSRGLLIALAVVVVVVVAAVAWWVARPQPEPTRVVPDEVKPVKFDFAEIAVKSPELEVGRADIKGAIYPTYTSWQVTVNCAEPEGCTGEFALDLSYHAGSEIRRIVMINRCEAPVGHELRFEGLQDQPSPVDRIDSVSLEVRDRRGLDRGRVEVPL
ncbi:MAG: hypothetical protein E4H44_01975 [Candidatus Aminicenantes bacterium]|nr:MAG: hypothetical protein E4H44_01975 [Candidatus Aminicenantes bacterium]